MTSSEGDAPHRLRDDGRPVMYRAFGTTHGLLVHATEAGVGPEVVAQWSDPQGRPYHGAPRATLDRPVVAALYSALGAWLREHPALPRGRGDD